MTGADAGTRTPDLRFTKATLFQLSYEGKARDFTSSGTQTGDIPLPREPAVGLEPTVIPVYKTGAVATEATPTYRIFITMKRASSPTHATERR